MKIEKSDADKIIELLKSGRKVELVYQRHLITRKMQLMMKVDEDKKFNIPEVDGFDIIPLEVVEEIK